MGYLDPLGMFYCIILDHIILYCILLYMFVPYHTIPYRYDTLLNKGSYDVWVTVNPGLGQEEPRWPQSGSELADFAFRTKSAVNMRLCTICYDDPRSYMEHLRI